MEKEFQSLPPPPLFIQAWGLIVSCLVSVTDRICDPRIFQGSWFKCIRQRKILFGAFFLIISWLEFFLDKLDLFIESN